MILKKGDGMSYNDLLSEFEPYMKKLASGDEDALQEMRIKLFTQMKHIEQLKDKVRKYFVLCIIKNNFLNFAKKKQRKVLVESSVSSDILENNGFTESNYVSIEDKIDASKILNKLQSVCNSTELQFIKLRMNPSEDLWDFYHKSSSNENRREIPWSVTAKYCQFGGNMQFRIKNKIRKVYKKMGYEEIACQF
jgi:hypothetical protein